MLAAARPRNTLCALIYGHFLAKLNFESAIIGPDPPTDEQTEFPS